MTRLLAALVLATSPALAAPTFPLLSTHDRAGAAAALAESFPTAWHAKVDVDEVGMPEVAELMLDQPVTDRDAVARITELVATHAKAFGVRDPKALHGEIDDFDVHLGEGDRWTGAIEAHYEGRHVFIRGHLWPVETPRSPSIEPAKLLARYIGLHGSRPSRCDCRPSDEVVTAVSDFHVSAGVAMICKDGVLSPHLAIAITPELGSAHVAGLDDLPHLIDAETGESIDADFVMPPYGAGSKAFPVEPFGQAYAGHRCFYR